MRVLVTGAGGFVGRRLVARLNAADHEVTGVDLEVDVADAHAVRAALERARADSVVHLAAISSIASTLEDPDAAFRVNYLGTRHVLEACLDVAPQSRVIVVGSGSVYGTASPDAPPFDESAPVRGDTPYARTKAAADLLAAQHSTRGLSVIRARPFNHTGAGRPDTFVESSFAKQVAEIEAGIRKPTIRVGNLDSVRDFLHVDDVVDAYERLLDPRVAPGAYNIASGTGRRIGDLLDVLLDLSTLSHRVEIVAEPSRFRATDRAVGDASRLRDATGWKPTRSFEAILAELLGGWRAAVRSRGQDPR